MENLKEVADHCPKPVQPVDTQCLPLSSSNEDDTRLKLNNSLLPSPTTHMELELKVVESHEQDPLDTQCQQDLLDTQCRPSSSSTEGIQSSNDTHGSVESVQSTNVTSLITGKSSGLNLISQFVSSEESSDDEDSSTDTSDDCMNLLSETEPSELKDQLPVSDNYPKVKGEIDYRELPSQDTCEVLFPVNGQMLPIGEVSHYTEKLVVIKSFPNTPPINEGSVLWRADMKSIARVFEIFGPVKTPFYSILVQSSDHANEMGLNPGDTVYVVPGDLDLTNYVFTNKLLLEKGCDASWKNDHEVPTEYQDYSDDEQESLRRKKGSSKQKGQRGGMNNRRNAQEMDRSGCGSVTMEHSGRGSVNGPPRPDIKPSIQTFHQPEPRPILYPPHVFPVPFPVPVQPFQPFPIYSPPPRTLYPPPWPGYPPPY